MNQRFRDLPIDKGVVLHFVPDEKQMDDWLNSLATIDFTLAAEKTLRAVRALEREDIAPTLKIKLLHKLHQFLPVIVQGLQKSYLDAKLPLSPPANRNVELVVWNYMQLARTWRHCKLKYLTLSKEQQARLLYLSLEALSQALVHIALSYKMPMHGFWALCYELYARAEQANLTQLDVALTGRSIQTIADLFKHLLLFYLCDTQQFRCRDMLTLFQCLVPTLSSAHILANYQSNWQTVVCVFNLNKDLPPQKINPHEARDDLSERFITTVSVAKKLYTTLQESKTHDNTLRTINHKVLLRALNALGLARKRKFTRVEEHTELKGIIGWHNVIAYLQSQTDVKAILPKLLPAKVEAKMARRAQLNEPDFALVPLGEEWNYQLRDALQGALAQNQQLSKIFTAATETKVVAMPIPAIVPIPSEAAGWCVFTLQNSSAKGYGLMTKISALDIKIGEVVALLSQGGKRLEIGLVQRINQFADYSLHLGVEIIGFESQLVYVTNCQTPAQGCWALLLPCVKSLNQPESLVLNSSLFKQADVVSVHRLQGQQRLQLHKILQSTAAVIHVQLAEVAESSASSF